MTTETTAYIAYGVVLQEGDIGWPDPFADDVDTHGGLSLECFGDSTECTRILCIKSSVAQAQGQPKLLRQEDLQLSAHWDDLLQSFCSKHNKQTEAAPSWLLFHTRL